MWPNLFVVGAERSGTTSLYAYLASVPDVFMSHIKEPRYFNDPLPEQWLSCVTEREEYLALFEDAGPCPVVGEASPSYLRDQAVAARIHEVSPQACIVILLRDPVERGYSHYLLHHTTGHELRSFSEVVLARATQDPSPYSSTLDPGFYHDAVARYLDVFGESQVMVLIFEEFVRDPVAAMANVLRLVGLDADPAAISYKRHNKRAVPKGSISGFVLHSDWVRRAGQRIPISVRRTVRDMITRSPEPTLTTSSEDRRLLQDLYREDVRALQSLLGRKLPWDWLRA